MKTVRCKWILTWKTATVNDDPRDVIGGKKAKARSVAVGFKDPGIGVVSNDSLSPTPTTDGGQVIIQQVNSRGWELVSFDVSTAFLHEKAGGRLVGIHSPSELAESMGMTPDCQCELVAGAYGRVDAPFLWLKKFQKSLLEEDSHNARWTLAFSPQPPKILQATP